MLFKYCTLEKPHRKMILIEYLEEPFAAFAGSYSIVLTFGFVPAYSTQKTLALLKACKTHVHFSRNCGGWASHIPVTEINK